MRYDDLLKVVYGSTVSDWQRTEAPFIHNWSYGNGSLDMLRPIIHSCAVLKENVSIALTWGAHNPNDTQPFQEPWVERFPNQSAHRYDYWLRLNGVGVHCWSAVAVDGGRYMILMPEIASSDGVETIYEIPADQMQIAELIFDLEGPGGSCRTLRDALNQAHVQFNDVS